MSDQKVRDSLGDRMKRQYEDRTRFMLPRRTWSVIRVDGKSFHTFMRGRTKPFDARLHAAMVAAAIALCEEAQGAKGGYVQSDEISIILTDFDSIATEAWFDGNIQKIASVAGSVVTAAFNDAWSRYDPEWGAALFDARVFTVPDPVEVENYLIWRQNDAIRNSVASLARSLYSAKQLHGKNQAEMLVMCADKGQQWENSPIHVQRGTVIRRTDNGGWGPDYDAPVFTKDRDYMAGLLAVIRKEAS